MHSNIHLIWDDSLKNYGLLKSIPLLKKSLNLQNYTFIAKPFYYISKNLRNPFYELKDYEINYILLNNYDIESKLKNLNHICQIITQKQAINDTYDITYSLIEYALNNPNFDLYIVSNRSKFKLESNSFENRNDRSIVDNFNLKQPKRYLAILKKYLRKFEKLHLLKFLKFTSNLMFLEICNEYNILFGDFEHFYEIWNFRRIIDNVNYEDFRLLKIISLFLNKFLEDENNEINEFLNIVLNPFLETDKTRIIKNIFYYYESINYNPKKINSEKKHV